MKILWKKEFIFFFLNVYPSNKNFFASSLYLFLRVFYSFLVLKFEVLTLKH